MAAKKHNPPAVPIGTPPTGHEPPNPPIDAPPPAAKAAKHVDVDLVPMRKDGVTLEVHSTTVAAHERAGWTRAD